MCNNFSLCCPYIPFMLILLFFGLYNLSFLFICDGFHNIGLMFFGCNETLWDVKYLTWHSYKILKFMFEHSVWVLHHLVNPYTITMYWSAAVMPYFTNNGKIWPPRNVLAYLSMGGITLLITVLHEIFEAVCKGVGWKYMHESLLDSLLGDTGLTIVASYLIASFMIRMGFIVPNAILLHYIPRLELLFRFLIYLGAFMAVDLLSLISKKVTCLPHGDSCESKFIHAGYNSYIFFKIFILLILKWQDDITIELNFKGKSNYQTVKRNSEDFNISIIYFLLVTWLSTFGMYFSMLYIPVYLSAIFYTLTWPVIYLLINSNNRHRHRR